MTVPGILHIHGNPPDDLIWKTCVHKPTVQQYVILEQDASVETVHGTMAARAGDVLMRGDTGEYYVLRMGSFQRVYDF